MTRYRLASMVPAGKRPSSRELEELEDDEELPGALPSVKAIVAMADPVCARATPQDAQKRLASGISVVHDGQRSIWGTCPIYGLIDEAKPGRLGRLGRASAQPLAPTLFHQIFLGYFQGHAARDGHYIVLTHGADQLMGCPWLKLEIARQPPDHIGGGHLQCAIERTDEFGLGTHADQVLGGLHSGPVDVRVLLHVH